jgi:hypothetical protein
MTLDTPFFLSGANWHGIETKLRRVEPSGPDEPDNLVLLAAGKREVSGESTIVGRWACSITSSLWPRLSTLTD